MEILLQFKNRKLMFSSRDIVIRSAVGLYDQNIAMASPDDLPGNAARNIKQYSQTLTSDHNELKVFFLAVVSRILAGARTLNYLDFV